MPKKVFKTKQVGVRFTEKLLTELRLSGKADTPQMALNFYENYYNFTKKDAEYYVSEDKANYKPLPKDTDDEDAPAEQDIPIVKDVLQSEQSERLKKLKEKL